MIRIVAMHVLRPWQCMSCGPLRPLGPPCMSSAPMHVLRPHVLRPCPAAPCPAAPAAPSCGPCGPCSRAVSRGAGSTTATLPLAQPARLAAGCARCRVAALTDVHGAARETCALEPCRLLPWNVTKRACCQYAHEGTARSIVLPWPFLCQRQDCSSGHARGIGESGNPESGTAG